MIELKKGLKVEVRRHQKWQAGVITAIHENRMLSVKFKFDDSESTEKVKPQQIRFVDASTMHLNVTDGVKSLAGGCPALQCIIVAKECVRALLEGHPELHWKRECAKKGMLNLAMINGLRNRVLRGASSTPVSVFDPRAAWGRARSSSLQSVRSRLGKRRAGSSDLSQALRQDGFWLPEGAPDDDASPGPQTWEGSPRGAVADLMKTSPY